MTRFVQRTRLATNIRRYGNALKKPIVLCIIIIIITLIRRSISQRIY